MSTRKNQLSLAEVRQMPADEIRQAVREGRCDETLAGRDPGAEPRARFTPPGADDGESYASAGEWLRSLPADELRRLLRERELDDLLARRVVKTCDPPAARTQ